MRKMEKRKKELLRKVGFAKEVDRIEAGRCPLCDKEINIETEFKDELSRREFGISGLCQDRVFADK